MVDYLIVGAGFSGLVAAEQLCSRYGKTCLVVDKRDHPGGNCYDCLDEHGVLIHPYGPHYFRTNSDQVLEYLSRFTRWIPGNYQVLAHTRGQYWSFPVNLGTFEQYLGRPSTSEEMEAWLAEHCETFDEITNSEEAVLSRFGREFYELFFEGYTLKQWQKHPRDLAPSVCGRIPLRTVRDGRYVSDRHQVLPADGYTRLFENMIDRCGDRLTLQLGTDYREVVATVKHRHLIFTGPIDAWFDYRHGPLPYRTLRFEREYYSPGALQKRKRGQPVNCDIFHDPESKEEKCTITRADPFSAPFSFSAPEGFIQPAVQVNYPGDEPWTRCVEAKHITRQRIAGSTLVREFPETYEIGKEPYYPIPFRESREIYAKYKADAETLDHVTFLGRLGTYAYLNMDQVVAMALKRVEDLVTGRR